MARDRKGFARPAWGWFLILDGGIGVLSLLALHAKSYELARKPARLPPRVALQGLLGATAVIHVAEAAHAGRVAGRHGLPRLAWTVQTFVVGFPSLRKLGVVTAQS